MKVFQIGSSLLEALAGERVLLNRPLVVSIRMAWGSTDRHDSMMLYCGYKLKLKQGARVNQGSGKVKLSECEESILFVFQVFPVTFCRSVSGKAISVESAKICD